MPADCDSHVIVELSDLEPFEPFEADLKPTPSLTGPMATPRQMCCAAGCWKYESSQPLGADPAWNIDVCTFVRRCSKKCLHAVVWFRLNTSECLHHVIISSFHAAIKTLTDGGAGPAFGWEATPSPVPRKNYCIQHCQNLGEELRIG